MREQRGEKTESLYLDVTKLKAVTLFQADGQLALCRACE